MKFTLVCLLVALCATSFAQEVEQTEVEMDQMDSQVYSLESMPDVEVLPEAELSELESPTARRFNCNNCMLLVGKLRSALIKQKSIVGVIKNYCDHTFKLARLWCTKTVEHRLPRLIDGIQFGMKDKMICKKQKAC